MYETELKEIQEALRDVPGKCRTCGERQWTREVKSAVARVAKNGRHPNSSIYANNCAQAEDGGREWLYDLVWAIEEKEWKLERLMLVMECEWSTDPDNRRYDFQKLLIAKAAMKLFVFKAPSVQKLEEAIKCLCKMIDAYEDKNNKENYLFAGLLYAESGNEQFKFFDQDGKSV